MTWTVKEIADEMKLAEATILRRLRSGEIRGLKVGDVWRVEDLQSYGCEAGREPSGGVLCLAGEIDNGLASVGDPSRLVFPTSTGLEFNKATWDNWRVRVFNKVAPKGMRPYDLRHSACSLWLRDPNISRMEAASWAGHSLQVQDATYAHVLMEGTGSAEAAIKAARQEVFGDAGREAM